MDIPKKSKMCEPIRNEAINRTKLFMATRRARILRAEAGYSWVKAKKTGLPPSGFTMGNSALRISRTLLAASSKGPSGRREYSRGEAMPVFWLRGEYAHPLFLVSVASKGLSPGRKFLVCNICGEIHKCCI